MAFCSLLLTLWSSRPAAAADAVALFRRGDVAERTGIYSGVKVIWVHCSENEPQAASPDYKRLARIWHGGPGRTRLEYSRTEGGPVRVVVENGSQRWLYSSRHEAWRPISWREPEPRLDLLLKNYRILPGPVETVAGRRALLVRVEPRFPGNPRKQSWLDLATGIPLRSDLYDHSGRLVSTSEFLSFQAERSLPASLFAVPAEAHAPALEPAPNERLSFDLALPRHLPHGYVLDRVTRSRDHGIEVLRARFTDGLNTLSLIQWRGRGEPEHQRRERFWGPGESIRWSTGRVQATLSGDLDAVELRRVARAMGEPRMGTSQLITQK